MTHAILYQDASAQPEPTPQPGPKTEQRKRRPQMTRLPGTEANPFQLRRRDVDVLEDLYTTRYLTVPQITALYWQEQRGGQDIAPLKACQRRMRALFHQGLVRRIEPLIQYSQGKKPLIYALDLAGAQVLREKRRI